MRDGRRRLTVLAVFLLRLSLAWSLEVRWLEALIRRALNKFVKRQQEREPDPKPTIVEDFLSHQEAETLLERYKPLLRESLHKDGAASTSTAKRSLYRTSRSVRLPPLGDALVFEIERRASALAGFNHSQVEDFQLACYEVDELYGLHRDDDAKGSANRSSTVLIYLQESSAGGSTLFTNRAIEEERDMDTKKELRTEAAAIKLFRHYCKHPKRRFTVVPPRQGRAVMWYNWYGDEKNGSSHHPRFASRSTHGACPVISGTKCVIQQWISRSKSHPLRDDRVVAIFPAGADYSFGTTTDATTSYSNPSETCWKDASARMGRTIPALCLDDNRSKVLAVPVGPYTGVGSLHLSTGLVAQVTSNDLLSTSGFTISFWARNIQNGTTLLSIGNFLKIHMLRAQDNNSKHVLELNGGRKNDVSSSSMERSRLEIPPDAMSDWLWISLAVSSSPEAVADLIIYSIQGGELLGKASLVDIEFASSCSADDDDDKHNNEGYDGPTTIFNAVELRFLSPTPLAVKSKGNKLDRHEGRAAAFVTTRTGDKVDDEEEDKAHDVSFIIVHNTALEEAERGILRRQAKRYDINT